jgi:xanthine dehydrogenase small subunit
MVLLGVRGKEGVRYRPVHSCLLPIGEAEGGHAVTIEGLNGKELNPLQRAFAGEFASQCGFCTPGFLVSLTGYFLDADRLEPEAAMDAVAGNLCRCTGYASIRRGIRRLCEEFDAPTFARARPGSPRRLDLLIRWGIVPPYFQPIQSRIRRPGRKNGSFRSGIIVGGGTDLFVGSPGVLEKGTPLFLSHRPELSGIRVVRGEVRVKAATSTEELLRFFPQLRSSVPLVSSWPVRLRATAGGNIINASPVGDVTVLLSALGSTLHLEKGKRRRAVSIERFFQGYKRLDLRKGELLREIRFRALSPSRRLSFEKVSRRTHMDIASVNSAAVVEVRGNRIVSARISAGGVAPVPLLLSGASSLLSGQTVGPDLLRGVIREAMTEISPISDVRGSASYKRIRLGRLIVAHFLRLFPERIPEETAW